jgi:hypothetical protein
MANDGLFNRQQHAASNPEKLFSNVQTLNQQYGQAWVSDLDEMTGGKLSRSASETQLGTLATSVANASQSGAYMEDMKPLFASQLNEGFLGSGVEDVTRGVQFSTTDALPLNGVGHLPPTAAGQDRDLRASVATDLGVQLGGVGEIGDGSFGSFVGQQAPPAADAAPAFPGPVNNSSFGNDNSTLDGPAAWPGRPDTAQSGEVTSLPTFDDYQMPGTEVGSGRGGWISQDPSAPGGVENLGDIEVSFADYDGSPTPAFNVGLSESSLSGGQASSANVDFGAGADHEM